MKHLFSFAFVFFIFTGYCAEINPNEDVCEKIGLKKININWLLSNERQFEEDFKTFMYCKFDSIDYQIILGPKKEMTKVIEMTLGLFVRQNNLDFSILFNDLIAPILELKKSENYPSLREMTISMNMIGAKKASIKTWPEDSLILRKMNYSDTNILVIKKLVVENNDSEVDYTYIFSIYAMQLKEKEAAANEQIELTIISDYEEGFKAAKETSMPVLLYFSGYYSVNSKHMEENVLENSEIKKIILFNYVFVKLMVDEKQIKLPENEQVYSTSLKRKMTTLGDKNAVIEMDKFKADSQPFFVIISPDGKEINTIHYTIDIEEFKKFLNSGLGK